MENGCDNLPDKERRTVRDRSLKGGGRVGMCGGGHNIENILKIFVFKQLFKTCLSSICLKVCYFCKAHITNA